MNKLNNCKDEDIFGICWKLKNGSNNSFEPGSKYELESSDSKSPSNLSSPPDSSFFDTVEDLATHISNVVRNASIGTQSIRKLSHNKTLHLQLPQHVSGSFDTLDGNKNVFRNGYCKKLNNKYTKGSYFYSLNNCSNYYELTSRLKSIKHLRRSQSTDCISSVFKNNLKICTENTCNTNFNQTNYLSQSNLDSKSDAVLLPNMFPSITNELCKESCATEISNTNFNSSHVLDDEDFDDFRTFSSSKLLTESQNQTTLSVDQKNYDAPDNPITKNPTIYKNEENFADFENAFIYPMADAMHNPQKKKPCSQLEKLIENISDTLEQIFTTNTETKLNNLLPFKPPQLNNDSNHLWKNIQQLWPTICDDTDSSAVKFVWDNSYAYSLYLHTIGVDPKISRRFLPDSITLLEPTPVVASTENTQSTPIIFPNPSVPNLEPFLREIISPLAGDNSKQMISNLDLDYFDEISNKTSKKSTPPISELEAEFVQQPSLILLVPPIKQTPLFSVNNSSSLQSNCAKDVKQNLPVLVSDVIKNLPDFSYVRKSTLTFPFSTNTCDLP